LKLGIGLAYQPVLRSFIDDPASPIDYLEVIPDTVWADLGFGREPRYVEDREAMTFLDDLNRRIPVIPHGIGLSIGSAHRFNRDQVLKLVEWQGRFAFPWHSDHLSYNLAEQGTAEVNVGLTMPLSYDQETLDLLVPRVLEIRRLVDVPFLLENNVYFFKLTGAEMNEADFLNRLCESSGCKLLLDLHNIHTNSRNHKFDPLQLLSAIDLGNVLELHVAGGMEKDGFYLDAHSGPLPGEVWDLLEWTLPRCPNLRGVTLEIVGSWVASLGEDRLRAELLRLQSAWLRHQPAPQPARA
jgi:uncharacterized protein (UPF0276 family)